eukprot:CFRG7109T1
MNVGYLYVCVSHVSTCLIGRKNHICSKMKAICAFLGALAVCASATSTQVNRRPMMQAIQAANGGDVINPSHGGDIPHGFCDDVHSVAGYFAVGSDKKYFYWAFESRGDPENDPVILWMTGGPGCSSQIALFKENGPCTLNDDNASTKPNPWSWNKHASMIYIDQPAGVGFSTGPVNDTGEWDAAPEMYNFLEAFFKANAHLQKNKFYIFGESYGGHYVPSLAARVQLNNKAKLKDEVQINLRGIGIGNGMTNPSLQYPQYSEYAFKNKYHHVVNQWGYSAMNLGKSGCVNLINKCSAGSSLSCPAAMEVCNMLFMMPITLQGINQYDVREKCEHPPLCYNFDSVSDFLNSESTKKVLGVESVEKWQSCNMIVNLHFMTDFMRDLSPNVTMLLEDNLDVLIYAGEADYICNWMGNNAWTLALPWHGHDGFNSAEVKDWKVNDKVMGTVRSFDNFKFLTIADAGHMVPMDQPESAQFMLDEFLSGDKQ